MRFHEKLPAPGPPCIRQRPWALPTLDHPQPHGLSCPGSLGLANPSAVQGTVLPECVQVPEFALLVPIPRPSVMLLPPPAMSFPLVSICPNSTQPSRFSQNSTPFLSYCPAEEPAFKTNQTVLQNCRHRSWVFLTRKETGVGNQKGLTGSHCWCG